MNRKSMTNLFKSLFALFLLTGIVFGQTTQSKNRETMVVRASSGLSLRQQPGINAERITLIPNEARVEKIETQSSVVVIDSIVGRWTKVKFQEKEGWAFGGFLDPVVEDPGDWITFTHPDIAFKFKYPASYKVRIGHFDNYPLNYSLQLYPLKTYLEREERYRGKNGSNDDVPPCIEISFGISPKEFLTELSWAQHNSSQSNFHNQAYRRCSIGAFPAICYEWSGLFEGKTVLALASGGKIIMATSMNVSDSEFAQVLTTFANK